MNGQAKITMGGLLVPLRFGYLAIKMFAEAAAQKHDVYFEGSTMTALGLAKLFQAAYINQCEAVEKKPELQFEHFVDWVEGVADDKEAAKEFQQALSVWAESQYTKKLVEFSKAAGESTKKKTGRTGRK